MKTDNNNILLTNLYKTHTNNIINMDNEKYLSLEQYFDDIVYNVEDEKLRNRIVYAHIIVEKFLFKSITSTS